MDGHGIEIGFPLLGSHSSGGNVIVYPLRLQRWKCHSANCIGHSFTFVTFRLVRCCPKSMGSGLAFGACIHCSHLYLGRLLCIYLACQVLRLFLEDVYGCHIERDNRDHHSLWSTGHMVAEQQARDQTIAFHIDAGQTGLRSLRNQTSLASRPGHNRPRPTLQSEKLWVPPL